MPAIKRSPGALQDGAFELTQAEKLVRFWRPTGLNFPSSTSSRNNGAIAVVRKIESNARKPLKREFRFRAPIIIRIAGRTKRRKVTKAETAFGKTDTANRRCAEENGCQVLIAPARYRSWRRDRAARIEQIVFAKEHRRDDEHVAFACRLNRFCQSLTISVQCFN